MLKPYWFYPSIEEDRNIADLIRVHLLLYSLCGLSGYNVINNHDVLVLSRAVLSWSSKYWAFEPVTFIVNLFDSKVLNHLVGATSNQWHGVLMWIVPLRCKSRRKKHGSSRVSFYLVHGMKYPYHIGHLLIQAGMEIYKINRYSGMELNFDGALFCVETALQQRIAWTSSRSSRSGYHVKRSHVYSQNAILDYKATLSAWHVGRVPNRHTANAYMIYKAEFVRLVFIATTDLLSYRSYNFLSGDTCLLQEKGNRKNLTADTTRVAAIIEFFSTTADHPCPTYISGRQ